MGAFRDFLKELFENWIKAPIVVIGDKITTLADRVHDAPYIFLIEHAKCVSFLKGDYESWEEHARTDPQIIAAYNSKVKVLEAEGMLTAADFALGYVGTGIAKGVKHIVVEAHKNLTPIFEDLMKEAELSETSRESIRKIAGSGEFGLNAVISFLLGVTLQPAISTSLSPVWRNLEQETNLRIRSSLLSPIDLVRADWRGELSEEWIQDEFARQGYQDEDITAFRNISKFYPSPHDLVSWQAREVYEPDMVKKYGLEDELEGVTKEPFYKSGMTDEQIRNFWVAHWQHPPWTVIRSMLFRTDLTEADVWDWFKTIEIPPFWRDKYIEIAYNPVTRVDLRRLYKSGEYTREQVYAGYQALGSSPEIAESLTKWTECDYAPDSKELTKAEVLKNYRIGEIAIDKVKTLLEALNYTSDQIEFVIAYEDYQLELKVKEEEAELLLVEYMNGTITFDAFKDNVEKAGFTQKAISKYIDKAKSKTRAAVKLPSKEDVTKWLSLKIITEEEFITMLSNLKYRSEDIVRYLKAEQKEK